jgi:hypothetical protein
MLEPHLGRLLRMLLWYARCVWHPVHAQQPALIWLKALMKDLVSPA